ncbi:MAG: DUF932 domain-containing protein [Gammaproteobacteria bacterium AqS3]|nr:DUF932 domain-containing protein [Gammaproteobacteria bacterium AqS3]
MAHLVETMAYAGEVPWHGLGVRVPHDLSPYEMQVAAGLDWTVEKQSMSTSEGIVIPNKKALVRSSDRSVLSIVSATWEPCQNETAFQFFDEFCRAGDMQMHTAGSLKNGRIVWVLAKVDESFELFGGDRVDSYLLFSNPHEFGHSIDIRFTPIRVVCNNTLTLSLRSVSNNSVKFSHHKQNFEITLKSAKKMLGLAQEQFYSYRQTAESLGEKRYRDETAIEYLDNLFPNFSEKKRGEYLHWDELSKTSKKIYQLIETQPGHQFRPGSWWNVFNAVTYFTDHERGDSADARLASAWFGKSRVLKVKALEKAIEYSKAA